MSMPAGTRLGPYEVLGLNGAGGMGEVCRALDTRLDRDVATKVLPESAPLYSDLLVLDFLTFVADVRGFERGARERRIREPDTRSRREGPAGRLRAGECRRGG